jgi:hypothetical protein
MAIPELTGSSDRIQCLPDADIISHGGLVALSALGNAATTIRDDNLSQNHNSTQPESPSQTTLTQMDNMCVGVGLQYTR